MTGTDLPWREEFPHVAALADGITRYLATVGITALVMAAGAGVTSLTGRESKAQVMFWCGCIYGARHFSFGGRR